MLREAAIKAETMRVHARAAATREAAGKAPSGFPSTGNRRTIGCTGPGPYSLSPGNGSKSEGPPPNEIEGPTEIGG